MNPIFDHLYENWKAVYSMPLGKERDGQMRTVRMLSKGNAHWFIRRLIGGIPSDPPDVLAKWIADGEALPPSEFLRQRREDLKRKN